MDIMYILGKESKHNNFELRHALRSIEQNLQGLDRVFVIGDDPGFLSDKVVFVPCPDPYKQKHKNMLYKIQYCTEHTDISDMFIVSSDDIFVMERMECSNIPCYHQGKLPESLGSNMDEESYEYNLYFTRSYLENRKLPTYRFAIHALHVVDKNIIKKNKELIDESYNARLGVEPFCLVNNMMLDANPRLNIKPLVDGKIMYAAGHDDFCMKTRRIPFFSCSDFALENGGQKVIYEYWPKKCKWEI